MIYMKFLRISDRYLKDNNPDAWLMKGDMNPVFSLIIYMEHMGIEPSVHSFAASKSKYPNPFKALMNLRI